MKNLIDIDDTQSIHVPLDSSSSIILNFESVPIKGIFNTDAYALYGEMGSVDIKISEMLRVTLNIEYAQFYSPSVHTINGQKFDLEMQISLYNPNIKSQKIMMAILYEKENNENSFISKVMKSSQEIINIDLMDAFNGISVINDYYEFEGSMTSYPCQENIR